jgi:hypothetical protein
MPFEPTYRVVPRDGGYAVMTANVKGVEFTCTVATPEKARAEQWAFALRRAAQVETDRRTAVRSGKRSIEDV